MAEANKLRVSELDFDQIKTNFKSYLKEQDIFRDYNLDGSTISHLLDVLSYNTHYNAFYLNMIANEMFIDSAVTRNAMISLAKMLGYTPKSRTGARANVDISITPDDSPSNVTIVKNTKFNSSINGVNFIFVTDQSYSTTANGDNATVTIKNVELVEGEPLSFTYTANTADTSQRFTIPNRGVKQAGFHVLVGASMPNVLVELGFITNRNDRRILSQSKYRQKMADAIFDAISKYKDEYEKNL